MKERKVWRFSCEFCHHGWFDKKKCAAHELRCVKNRERVCGFCSSHSIKQASMSKLLAVLEDKGLDPEVLREVAGGCPMCMLAAVTAINEMEGYTRRNEDYWWFDYRKEMERFDAQESTNG